jgi:spermidine synthase
MTENWITEQLHPYYRSALHCLEVLVDEQTEFQHIQVVRTEFFGNTLILDGIIQLTELDNMGYHEMITHVPLLACENPKRVLIVGGGDGGSLQQVLKHTSVEEVVVCELDRGVVDISRKYFPLFGDPFSNPRAHLVIEDAFTYLQKAEQRFDVIISDTTDPIGEAEKLFSEDFYKLMAAALTPNGAISTQCEQLFFDSDLIVEIYKMGLRIFQHPAYYNALIPTYPGGGIGFMYLSNIPWTNGLNKEYPTGLNYINHEVHQSAFALPEFFRKKLG